MARSSCRSPSQCSTPTTSTLWRRRILEQEHMAYSEAINIVLEGKFEIAGRRLVKKTLT